MKAVSRRRHPNEAQILSSAVGIVLMLTLTSHAKANPTTQLLLSRDASRGGGEEYKGVNPKYRPRGYNEGPKKD